jgi:hypothetical protein
MNLFYYINDSSSIWEADYLESNAIMADYVIKEYPDALYTSDSDIRGYMNILFHRGIYECQTLESSEQIANQRGAEQIVYIIKEKTKVLYILIEDLTTGRMRMIEECDGTICTYEVTRSSWE